MVHAGHLDHHPGRVGPRSDSACRATVTCWASTPAGTRQQGMHGRYPRATSMRPGQAMPGQVHREHPAGAEKQRGDRRPVHRRALPAHGRTPPQNCRLTCRSRGSEPGRPGQPTARASPRPAPARHRRPGLNQHQAGLLPHRPAAAPTPPPSPRPRRPDTGNQVTAAAQQTVHSPHRRRGTSLMIR